VRALGEVFDCGKTQIGKILKSKESLLSMYETNASGSRVHTARTQRPSEFEEVNKTLYQWYILACSKNINPGGAQLIEKAKEIAECIGKTEFKGSRGWLDKWKKRYNVKQLGNQQMFGEVLLTPGKSVYLKLLRIMTRNTYGAWTKREYFAGIADLDRRASNFVEARNV
jgi:hypothetical protein